MKTNAPDCYSVKPHLSDIGPEGERNIVISIKQGRIKADPHSLGHKFIVEVAVCPTDVKDLVEFIATPTLDKKTQKLPLTYRKADSLLAERASLPPAQSSPSPSPQKETRTTVFEHASPIMPSPVSEFKTGKSSTTQRTGRHGKEGIQDEYKGKYINLQAEYVTHMFTRR